MLNQITESDRLTFRVEGNAGSGPFRVAITKVAVWT